MRLKFGLAALIGLLLSSSAVLAQEGSTGRVAGTVTDAEGRAALPSATVTVVGTNRRATTDADGRFTISGVAAGAHRVRVTRLGFLPVESTVTVVADQEAVADFAMRASAFSLETQVVVGYGTQRRADLTGSVASVTPDASQITQSVEQMIQGKVAGVQVTQASSEPGGGISIRIRGGSSINGNNEPLYVIDGFPVENDLQASSPGDGGRDHTVPFNPLNALNPSDIESIDILKDAAATSIYGARGANGVVIITTRRGAGAKPRVTVDSYIGRQSVAKRYDLLGGQDFAAFVNAWGAAQATPVTVYTQPQIDAIGAGTDWQSQIFRDGVPMRSLQLGVSGATASSNPTRYAISGGVVDQNGVVIGSEFRRVSFHGNVDQSVGTRLRASSNVLLSRVATTAIPTNGGSNQSAGAIGAALQYYPTFGVRRPDGTYTLLAEDGPVALAPSTVPNPVSLVRDVNDRLGDSRALANLFGEYTLGRGFMLRVSGGADYSARTRDTYYPRTTLQGRGVDGEARRGRNESLGLLNENTLSFQPSAGRFGNLNALLGYTRQKQNVKTVSMINSNYVSDITGFEDFGAGARPNGPGITTGRQDWTFVSYLGRLNYTLKDRYLFTVTDRRDGSSRFGEGNKWGNFPSAAFAWVVTEEPFAKNRAVVNSLKFRVSWGIAGNPSIRPYQALTRLAAQSYAFNGTPSTGYYPQVLGNPNLSWETTQERNFGADMLLFNGRIDFTADFYNKHTRDLLLAKQLPLDVGFGTVLVNTGSLRNTGREFSITGNLVRGDTRAGGFTWTSSLNYASNTNRVLDLGGDTLLFAARAADDIGINGTIIKIGQPLGVFFGYKVGGILRSAEEAAAYTAIVAPPTGTAWAAGDQRIVDINGDGLINVNDRTIIGNPIPKYTLGWTNNLGWKGLDLSTTLDGSYGATLFNLNMNRLESGSPRTNILRERWTDAWTPQNTTGKYPRIGGSILNIGTDMTSDMLEDGTYTRLRSITLGYTVPTRVVSRRGISSVRVYITGTNLVTWTDYTGFNPDVSSISVGNVNRGIDVGAYPLSKAVTFGFNLSY
jgi:TonB-linked SusC/RagA family outer membrane protein